MSEERSIQLNRQELWALQGLVKPLVPEGSQAVVAMVQLEEERVPAPLTLRQKVNSALLRMADEQPSPDRVDVSLSAEELWIIDSVLNRELGDWAEALLIRVFRAFDSLALGIPLMSREEAAAHTQSRGADGEEIPA